LRNDPAATPSLWRALKRPLKRAYYFGRRRECPFCRSHVRAFRPWGEDFPVLREKQVVGGQRRDDCLCPVCRSIDRERLLYLYLLNETAIFRDDVELLHIAPEQRLRATLERAANVRYTTADLAAPDVTMRMDITDIPSPDGSFDAIICSHVLEHVPDDRRAMAELHRVLRPGGWAVLQVPMSLTLPATYEDPSIVDAAARERAFGQFDHVRIYALDYVDRLAASGFAVEAFSWPRTVAYGGAENRYGLDEREPVFIARKPKP
jgi:SAM-dependent methyltransferase